MRKGVNAFQDGSPKIKKPPVNRRLALVKAAILGLLPWRPGGQIFFLTFFFVVRGFAFAFALFLGFAFALDVDFDLATALALTAPLA